MSLIEDALRKVQDPITRLDPKPTTQPQNAAQPSTIEPPAVHSWTAPSSMQTPSKPRHPLNVLLLVAVAVFALTLVLVVWGSIWIGHLLGITSPVAMLSPQPHPATAVTSSPMPTHPVAAPSVEAELSQTHFLLSGVVEGGEPYAVINGTVVGIGEQIEGATVAEVANGSVTLRRQDGSELQLRVPR